MRHSRGRFAEAEEHVRTAWEESEKRCAESAETHVFAVHLAMVLRELSQPREAERLLRDALEALDRLKGKQHPDTPPGLEAASKADC